MTPLQPQPNRMVRRLVALGLVSVVAFFAAQGEAADAQQLRFQARGSAEARPTVPPPVAHGISATPRLGRPTPTSRGSSGQATLPLRGASAPGFVVAAADRLTDSAPPNTTARRPVERAPPQFH